MFFLLRRLLALAAALLLVAAFSVFASDEPQLTEEQIKEFLMTADVIGFRQTSKGITAPQRLTLSDGNLTHDAVFQAIDEKKTMMELKSGPEMNFRDSYHFNIAAYELAKLVGLGDMVPVTIERKWRGQYGSLAWYFPWKWDEVMRLKEKPQCPDINAFNKQMNRMWVFSELVYDTDRNQTNMLISEDWKLCMIDFSRAFRLYDKLEEPRHMVMCDHWLLDKLRQLDQAEVLEKTKPHLSKGEVKGIMARRDKILAHFQALVAQKGEDKVLY